MSTITSQDQSILPGIAAPAKLVRSEDVSVEETKVPLPPGLQTVHLTEEAAQILRTLLDDEAHPTFEGREMPTVDASVLLKKNP